MCDRCRASLASCQPIPPSPQLAKAVPSLAHRAGIERGQAKPICCALTLTILLQLLRVLRVRAVALLPAQRRREEVFSNHPFPDGAKTFPARFQIPAQPAYARELLLRQPVCRAIPPPEVRWEKMA